MGVNGLKSTSDRWTRTALVEATRVGDKDVARGRRPIVLEAVSDHYGAIQRIEDVSENDVRGAIEGHQDGNDGAQLTGPKGREERGVVAIWKTTFFCEDRLERENGRGT